MSSSASQKRRILAIFRLGESKSRQACHAVAMSAGGSHPTLRKDDYFFRVD